jgi:hypothetical protein
MISGTGGGFTSVCQVWAAAVICITSRIAREKITRGPLDRKLVLTMLVVATMAGSCGQAERFRIRVSFSNRAGF